MESNGEITSYFDGNKERMLNRYYMPREDVAAAYPEWSEAILGKAPAFMEVNGERISSHPLYDHAAYFDQLHERIGGLPL